ncbi:4Fe-4S ferredoxin [Clostridium sp. SYSU_GA19001]|uniref:ATP-binding protein n=1 Tax=Clostridium caldaquaticum TaxID=2940653 RepID=UPI0020778ABD|nr:4Fe-4S dicluster domain-containing protein [Clostridium caldaquaticum]MCM8709668.1 4Fe-4S ferredoxin [Clostridium caldaquaticum]
MAVRKIVSIDESKCDGCGLCIPNCAEGALAIIDGKAKLIKDLYCDGLGACLGHCPKDAITIIEREAEEFDEKAVEEFLKTQGRKMQHVQETKTKENTEVHVHEGGCPGSRMRMLQRKEAENDDSNVKVTSKLRQWPVQLQLVPAAAPYFKRADLLITADCVPFAYANYHNDFLKGKAVAVGCPKLDDAMSYAKKLEDIIRINDLESITVLRMEVPCCGGIAQAVKMGRDNSGVNIPIKVVTISLEGEILKREYI